jgi:hypothetical protein
MAFAIHYSDVAVEQLRAMRSFDRTAVLDQIEHVLAVNPMLESKARIKQLRQPAPAQEGST